MVTLKRSIVLGAICAACAVMPSAAQDAAGPRILTPLHVDAARFTAVGSAEFGVGADTTQTVDGFAGQGFGTIVLMAQNNMAMCSGLTLHYASGETEAYPLVTPGILNQLQIYQLAPRGNAGDITAIDANCHAPSGDGVTIAFSAMPGVVFEPVHPDPAAHGAPAHGAPMGED